MFYGEFEHALDAKGRVIIPSKFRDILRKKRIGKFYITRGLDRCLFVFPENEWKAQDQKFKQLPFTKQEARQFNRLYFSGALDSAPDKQGRILLPKYLKDYAHIRRDILIVGVSNRMEIWAKDKWEEFYRSSKESFEDVAEKLIDLE